jgi:hypothetical protein
MTEWTKAISSTPTMTLRRPKSFIMLLHIHRPRTWAPCQNILASKEAFVLA